MAYEATIVTETEPAITFLCSDITGMEKGEVVKLSGSRTVAKTSASGDICGGIVKVEKIAGTGTGVNYPVSVYRHGIFLAYVSGTVAFGQSLTTGPLANVFVLATNTISGSKVWGTSLESHSGAASLCTIELNPGVCPGI